MGIVVTPLCTVIESHYVEQVAEGDHWVQLIVDHEIAKWVIDSGINLVVVRDTYADVEIRVSKIDFTMIALRWGLY